MKADDARAKIDSIIAELNAAETDPKKRMVVAWGRRDDDDDEGALISFADKGVWDIEASLWAVDESDASEIIVDLAAVFEDRHVLPQMDARRLFNVLDAMRPGVTLQLQPVRAGRQSSLSTIAVFGVQTGLPASGLTARQLDSAIGWLLTSANAAERILHGHATKEDDAWARMLPRRKGHKPDDD